MLSILRALNMSLFCKGDTEIIVFAVIKLFIETCYKYNWCIMALFQNETGFYLGSGSPKSSNTWKKGIKSSRFVCFPVIDITRNLNSFCSSRCCTNWVYICLIKVLGLFPNFSNFLVTHSPS